MKKIIIKIDQGIVTDVLADEEISVQVVDYDIDGLPDEQLYAIPQAGSVENAYVYEGQFLTKDPEGLKEVVDAIDEQNKRRG